MIGDKLISKGAKMPAKGKSLASEPRPDIAGIRSGAELRRWYWLKDELLAEARRVGVKATGGKFLLLERICHHRDTGETVFPGDVRKKPESKFDWHSAPLAGDTVITDSYRNTQNVRRWFKSNVDTAFKFNIAFMEWMKRNAGKTLNEAADAWQHQKAEALRPDYKTEIKAHNQFNQYTRDFLADNPDKGMKEVRKYWALKRQLPSENGRHVYERSDLELG